MATAPVVNTPQMVYRGLVSQRDILGDQLSDANQLRQNLVSQLADPKQSVATKASLEKRIANVDQRIADLDAQIAKSDAAVAQAAAVPGATVRPPAPQQRGPSDGEFAMFALFMLVAILPMSIAFARRIWRRSARAEVTIPAEMSQRMESLERGVEAIALEVERIGEGQRFVTRALAERGEVAGRALGAGAAQPVPVRQRDRAEERR